MQRSGIRSSKEPVYLQEFELFTLARVLIAQGYAQPNKQPWQDALDLLAQLRRTAREGGRLGRVVEASLLEALIYQGMGKADSALASLEPALALGQPEGYVRIFADEGEPMARLLYLAADSGLFVDYAGKLLGAIPNLDAEGALPLSEKMIEPLSDREREVLGLIAEGHTNQELAAALHLSINTVKVHCSNIYGKLGVNTRTQAVAKARALGVLQPG